MEAVLREELRDLPQGWFHHGAEVLALVERHRPMVTVELGSWRGASAIALARLVRQWRGEVFCVDTWMGTAADVPGGPLMLAECARSARLACVSGSIRFINATTLDAATWWTLPVDFLYVDADHSYQSVRDDLAAWVPHVRAGGLIAGDDYESTVFPGVTRAWDEFEAQRSWRFTRGEPNPTSDPPNMRLIYGTKP
jgi:predicted O-methyltransferase YrrM